MCCARGRSGRSLNAEKVMHTLNMLRRVCELPNPEAVLNTYRFLNLAYGFASRRHAHGITEGCDRCFKNAYLKSHTFSILPVCYMFHLTLLLFTFEKKEFRSCARGRQWCGIIHYF